jgi:hypothetical protein
MIKKSIKIKKDDLNPEPVELLAKSIIQVSEASEKLLSSGLNMRGLVVLLQHKIGASNISQYQIQLVLENLPKLRAWYINN